MVTQWCRCGCCQHNSVECKDNSRCRCLPSGPSHSTGPRTRIIEMDRDSESRAPGPSGPPRARRAWAWTRLDVKPPGGLLSISASTQHRPWLSQFWLAHRVRQARARPAGRDYRVLRWGPAASRHIVYGQWPQRHIAMTRTQPSSKLTGGPKGTMRV